MTNKRIRVALAQGRYEDLETLTHESRRTTTPLKYFLAAYEMVIGHGDHAIELLEEASSEREPNAIHAIQKIHTITTATACPG